MTRQTDAPLQPVGLYANNYTADYYVNGVHDGLILLAPPYQRGLVWTEEQRVELLRSLLTGIPTGSIILNDRMTPAWKDANPSYSLEDPSFVVIDGQQRVDTILRWFDSRLLLPQSWFTADALDGTFTETSDGPYVTFADLSQPGRRRCGHRFLMSTHVAHFATIGEEIDTYQRVNRGGTPHTSQDIEHAIRTAGK